MRYLDPAFLPTGQVGSQDPRSVLREQGRDRSETQVESARSGNEYS